MRFSKSTPDSMLAQIGRRDSEDPPPALGPFLRKDQSGFDGFAESYFISEQCTLRKRRRESEERGVYLVRIEIDLCVDERGRELLHAVGRVATGQLVGEVFCVVVR